MIRPSSRLIQLAVVAVLGVGAYFVYSVLARQGYGSLAQAPLNTQVQVPPSFIMALDDSGSMVWEALNNTRDGVYAWSQAAASFYSGMAPRGYDGGDENFYYMFPAYGRGSEGAIPPIDAFGFSRSPDVNPGYFDPRASYPTWKQADGSDFTTIDPTRAPVDPRIPSAPNRINADVDLTAPISRNNANWHFRVRRGMVLPAGSVVRNSGGRGCSALPTNIGNGGFTTLAENRTINEDACNIFFEFYTPVFFLVDPSTLASEYGYSADPVAVTDPPGGRPGTLYKYEIRPGNFANTAQYQAAMQNFANWFSFYRIRREALVGGLTNALVDFNNLRVGWFRINNQRAVTMHDMGVTARKQDLFDDIFRDFRATGSTPNRQAVRYLGEQFKRTGAAAPVQLTCQKNAGMLFTDGYINDPSSPGGYGNADGGLGAPFADLVSNTVADIVVPYYRESLVPGLETNSVLVPTGCDTASPDPRLDCQKNLHMNFYAITLGTLGRMYGVSYAQNEFAPWTTTPDPFDVPPMWHGTREDLTPNAVDELWHATINSRGEMINAKQPADIIAAIRRILTTVSSGASPSGTIALTGARVGVGSLSVEPFYEARNEGTDWYSTLTAYELEIAPVTRAVTSSVAWEASAKMPAPLVRDIFYGGDSGAVEFSAANVDFPDLCDTSPLSRCNASSSYIGPGRTLDVTIAEAVAYLRGDTSLELRHGGKMRDRTTVLGDIVNSSPVISAPTDDYGHRSIGDATLRTSYQTYLTTKRSTRRVMVYAGANDGMLHAFDGGMDVDGVMDTRGGRERFAYIPQAVLGHVGNLLFPYNPFEAGNQRFDHRYYVDGPISIGDVMYGSEWHTALVGTMGAGGRGAFALEVDDAATDGVATPFSSGHRLWEINDVNATLDDDVRENIGHVLGSPVVVPYKTTAGAISFKAIFGNGYNSTSGKAVLYVVDFGTGTPKIQMIEAIEAGAPPAGEKNGLGNIVAVDRWTGTGLTLRGRDGFADMVYGADQKGAIWKFDLRTLNDTANRVTTITTPLFVTQTINESGVVSRQPILGGLTAASGPSGGVMVYFGTGSFSFANDQRDTTRQSIYAVLDTGAGTTQTIANLLEQEIISTAGDGSRKTSSHTSMSQRGWYLNLPAGERAVGYPRLESGILFVPTYVPQAGGSGCSTSGFNFLFGLNALSGGAALSNVRYDSPTGSSPGAGTGAITLNTGGTAPVKDVAVMTTPRLPPLAAGSDPGDLDDALDTDCSMVVRVAGAPPLYLPRACGRQSWRQIQ